MEEINLVFQSIMKWGVGIQMFMVMILVILLAQVTRILVRLNTLVEEKKKETS